MAVSAVAQDLVFSAKVDKTTLSIGEPLTLTITLSGDVADAQIPSVTVPDVFAVLGRSQSTNVSIRAGAMDRSTSLVLALVPQQEGTFQLGPFTMTQQQKEFHTDPITVTVNKPSVPPGLPPHGGRVTL